MKIEIVEVNEFKDIASLVEEVQNLHADLFPNVYKPFEYGEIEKAMQTMLSNEKCKLFIAQTSEVTIGYIMVLIKEIPESAFHYSFRLIHIDQIAVAESHKRTRVGTMLLRKVEELAKDLNIHRLELDHLDNNSIAKTFFYSKGFLPYRSKLMKQLML